MFSNLNPFSSSNLSLLKVLNGISKSLGITRQILPLYKDIKPLLQEIPNVLNKIRNISFIKKNNDEIYLKNDYASESPQNNGPQFFK